MDNDFTRELKARVLEWGGAQRWYRGELDAKAVRQAVIDAGGHATLFRGEDRRGEVFQPLPPELLRTKVPATRPAST